MTRLRMAVIGVGHLGQHHARILAGLPDVELVGVVDANPEQARSIAERLNTDAVRFASSRSRSQVDAVSVVTPTIHHHAVASAFLKAGVPVLVEKPVCRTVAEADDLIALADRSGRAVPGRAHRAVQSRRSRSWPSGRSAPKFVEAERHGPFTGRSIDIGAVLDLMIHDLDLLLSLVGIAGEGRVGGRARRCSAGTRTWSTPGSNSTNGCVAHVTASRITRLPEAPAARLGAGGVRGHRLRDPEADAGAAERRGSPSRASRR